LGSSLISEAQKSDMDFAFKDINDFKKLDYIACWFFKGSKFIRNINASFSFVSTNSICQGEQVWMLWPLIFKNEQCISYAYNSFNWSNNAKDKAGVTVIIVGVTNNISSKPKYLFQNNIKQIVNNISPYLIKGPSTFIYPRRTPLSKLPEMVSGSKPTDGGYLIISQSEKELLVNENKAIEKYLKRYVGADDFINDNIRYCIWISDIEKDNALSYTFIKDRVEKCRLFRSSSKKEATKSKAITPYKFDEVKHQETNSIIFPITTSFRRKYVPIGFLDSSSIISNSALAVYQADVDLFGVLTSRMNVVWLSVTGSRMRNDFRYSVNYCYNNFPFPSILDSQKKEIEKFVYRILAERENHSDKTLGQLYDPDKMPQGLLEAHHQLDLAVEQCYRSKPFESDEERLEYLFKLYEQMIAEEKNKGTLFEAEEKTKKKPKKK
jgi:hypothetical protein